eukprot:CAMPEP_0180699978 /NCGR_PEP_ID=MMETSP1038_2-20121128/4829_1 /TAXON_ID=632150 /ORGANISM="Azadinium spinosum, Strain 3D9" /LENGTH=64 /DNA_ID=CAMNT_0022731617 /DNA_START=293 /DNA_END=484 /DNA_ORIENTATION=-
MSAPLRLATSHSSLAAASAAHISSASRAAASASFKATLCLPEREARAAYCSATSARATRPASLP